jgi:hypothetical protein
MRARAIRVVASCVGTLALLGCGGDDGTDPGDTTSIAVPRLLTPAMGAHLTQNDATIGCPWDETRGYGFRYAFDWADVPTATEYVVLHGRLPLGAMYPETVTTSELASTKCGDFVSDIYLEGWGWRVGAVVPATGGHRDTLWSQTRGFGFWPCRLPDGQHCYAVQ